ncbi:MlaC/ttg2D family ABC transporter substrate-binding protein [Undibacterium sp. TC9W]|uniref:MlaC/ttg2D family ABC transporter substrate-binding protein n=1 Tax=Undibacterium sp. TC9W TaxID=3413053 RepID=UPI003BF01235
MLKQLLIPVTFILALSTQGAAHAYDTSSPEGLIREMSADILDTINSDEAIKAGDTSKLSALVEAKLMSGLNIERMTSSTLGRNYRAPTPEQLFRLQEEFKVRVARLYAGAISRVKANATIKQKSRLREGHEIDLEVYTEIQNQDQTDEPIEIKYRLGITNNGWKIIDIKILDSWLSRLYGAAFAAQINASGVESLINRLASMNKRALDNN